MMIKKAHTSIIRNSFFYLVEGKGMSVRAAALKLDINVCTAQGWVSKHYEDPQEYIQKSFNSIRPLGRPPVLTNEHKDYMIHQADENTDSVMLEGMLDVLTEKFGYLQITKSSFNKFVRQKCRVTFKQAHRLGFHKQLCVHRRSNLPYKSEEELFLV
jgi:transposase